MSSRVTSLRPPWQSNLLSQGALERACMNIDGEYDFPGLVISALYGYKDMISGLLRKGAELRNAGGVLFWNSIG